MITDLLERQAVLTKRWHRHGAGMRPPLAAGDVQLAQAALYHVVERPGRQRPERASG